MQGQHQPKIKNKEKMNLLLKNKTINDLFTHLSPDADVMDLFVVQVPMDLVSPHANP